MADEILIAKTTAAGESRPCLATRCVTRLRHLILVGAVLGFLALLAYGLVRKAPDTSIADSLAAGKLAEASGFDLEVLEPGRPGGRLEAAVERAAANGRIALGELRGTPIVLNFWASWCAPCREEAELLQRTWERERDKGVLFVGLNMQDARSDARGFLEEFGIDYPTIRESERDTAQAFGATGVPETYFIAADGRVAGRHVGPIEAEELQAGLDAARTGRPLGAQADVRTPGFKLVPVKPERESPQGK